MRKFHQTLRKRLSKSEINNLYLIKNPRSESGDFYLANFQVYKFGIVRFRLASSSLIRLVNLRAFVA